MHLADIIASESEIRVVVELTTKKSPTHQSEQLVWKAARASGAAPSFFRPETNFVDGGILANNPSLALLTEIAEFNVAKKALDHDEEVVRPYVMLSLGTGVPPVKKTNVVDIFRVRFRLFHGGRKVMKLKSMDNNLIS